MARGSDKVDAPALELDADKTAEFPLTGHSADQETATDQPVIKPESSEADPMKTGRY